VVEYALIFGLGFLTAALAGLLLAPAIFRRIVRFAENRILATVPVSPGELRAQKDMVRAEMAVAIARTGHDLRMERHKAADYAIANDQLSAETSRLYGENADLKAEIEELGVQASELRSAIRNEELRLEQAMQQLASQEASERTKDGRIDELEHRVQRLSAETDNLKIDLATRDTEAESLKSRIASLRDEREGLRNDLRLATQRAKDAELRLARESNRAIRLEERLNSEVSSSVDKDTVIERRVAEINRLKERLKQANASAREPNPPQKASTVQKLPVTQRMRSTISAPTVAPAPVALLEPPASPMALVATAASVAPAEPIAERPAAGISVLPSRFISEERAAQLADEVRAQASDLSDNLMARTDDRGDDALRAEIADIAAKMIAIVGQREGINSPIRAMISGRPQQGRDGRVSLAERASRLVHQD
jgi:predicted  nucleic acid-binding Zn-ribbon protein